MQLIWTRNSGFVLNGQEISKLKLLFSNNFEKVYIVEAGKYTGKLRLTAVLQWVNPHDYCDIEFESGGTQLEIIRPPALLNQREKLKNILLQAEFM